MTESFLERFHKEKNIGNISITIRKFGIIFAVFVIGIVLINTSGCANKGSNDTLPSAESLNTETADISEQQDTIKVGDDGVNAAIAPDIPGSSEILSEAASLDNMVSISLENTGRADPFLPDGISSYSGSTYTPPVKPPSYILAPPQSITTDEDAVSVIQTKVSGIMYDKSNPSAILNINGSDYLVRSGDIINSYKILAIGPDNVTVQLGHNIYKAGVGQLFAGNEIKYNTVSNLSTKFGGTKNKVNMRN